MAKQYIIVDIDGTIADGTHRVHHLESNPKDWDSYYSKCYGDEPIMSICRIVRVFACNTASQIIYCTGRRESCREDTIKWLYEKCLPFDVPLLMRANGDTRHDVIVKPELLQNHGISFNDIEFILEDRNSMVKKWRELGITCLHVAEGNF